MTNKKPTIDVTATKTAAQTTDKSENKANASTKATTAKTKANPTTTAKAHAKTKAKPAEPDPSPAPRPASSGGGGLLVWLLVFLIVMAGAVSVGWPFVKPYVGDQIRTVVENSRDRLGLTPRPTQAQMPSKIESTATPEPLPTPTVKAPPSSDPMSKSAPAESVSAGVLAIADTTPKAVVTPAPMDQLKNKINILESQLAALTSTVSTSGDGQVALAATDQLAQTLAGLKTQLTALNDRMDGLETALKESQSAQSKAAGKAQALVLAATQLRVRLMGDGPFSVELTALEGIAGKDTAVMDAVNRLRPNAEIGVPSEAALMARFSAVAMDISHANASSNEGGWIGTVKNSLSGLVSVRRTDPNQVTNPVERAIAVSEASMKMGDLESAVKALSALQGPEGEAAAAWLGDARARVDSEAALEALYNQALAAMAQVSGS